MKICKKDGCLFNGKPQPRDNFRKLLTASDGLRSHCKSCENEYAKERQRMKYNEKKDFNKMF